MLSLPRNLKVMSSPRIIIQETGNALLFYNIIILPYSYPYSVGRECGDYKPVLLKPRNTGTYNSRQVIFADNLDMFADNFLKADNIDIEGNCLQIWFMSGFLGSSIPGFLQDCSRHCPKFFILSLHVRVRSEFFYIKVI